MAITHIDCFFHSGRAVQQGGASFVALNPHARPGSFIFAGAAALKESLGSQVACKLAIEHFSEAVLDFFDKPARNGKGLHAEISQAVLEQAFRNANTSVYEFGHKLAAGGRMATSMLGLVVAEKLVAVGRVGPGTAYLCRQGELFPFFEERKEVQSPAGALGQNLVGAQSLVAVELSSVPFEQGDSIYVFSSELKAAQEVTLKRTAPLTEVGSAGEAKFEDLVSSLFPNSTELSYGLLAQVGPDTIYLGNMAARL